MIERVTSNFIAITSHVRKISRPQGTGGRSLRAHVSEERFRKWGCDDRGSMNAL